MPKFAIGQVRVELEAGHLSSMGSSGAIPLKNLWSVRWIGVGTLPKFLGPHVKRRGAICESSICKYRVSLIRDFWISHVVFVQRWWDQLCRQFVKRLEGCKNFRQIDPRVLEIVANGALQQSAEIEREISSEVALGAPGYPGRGGLC